MEKVKNGLARLSVALVIVRVRYILKMMNGNANYPNPNPTIQALSDEVNDLDLLDQSVTAGDRTKTKLRDSIFIALKQNMTFLAGYVNAVSAGKVAMLETSGFEFEKQRTPVSAPGTVKKITVKNAAVSGTSDLFWSGEKDKTYYMVQVSNDSTKENMWNTVAQPTNRKCTIEGLTTGQWAYFRVCAVNRAGQGVWSDVTKLMVA